MEQVFDDFVEIAVAANQNMSTDFRHQTICTIELTGTLLLLLADGSWYTTAVPLDFDSVVPVSSIRTKTQRRKWWWRLNARTQPIIEKINQTSLFSWPTTQTFFNDIYKVSANTKIDLTTFYVLKIVWENLKNSLGPAPGIIKYSQSKIWNCFLSKLNLKSSNTCYICK